MSQGKALSEEITELFQSEQAVIKVDDLLKKAEHKGFGFLFMFLALPIALPFTPPGLSTPFGLLIISLAVQVILGRDTPWFPSKLREKTIRQGSTKFLLKMSKWLKFFERLLRPRVSWLYRTRVFRYLVGPFILLAGIGLSMPLPITNTVFSMAVFLIGLGMMEEDGLFGLAGMTITASGFILMGVLIWYVIRYGPEGIHRFEDFIKRRG
jgi:hypothetical protein